MAAGARYLLTLGMVLLLVFICHGADQSIVVAPENAIEKPKPDGSTTTNHANHGGVQMGVSDPTCDDGVVNIQIDYSRPVLRKVCRCMGGGTKGRRDFKKVQELRKYKGQGGGKPTGAPVLAKEECEEQTKEPLHKCLNEVIKYESDIPTSGSHRPLWPKFGEYLYLPPQRWIHNLEHGAIVFLYHPCADEAEVNQLRTIATSCLNKHIITPYENLPPEYPFAVLSWGCKLLLPSVDEAKIKDFMTRKALTAPETHTAEEGQYDVGLIHGIGLNIYETAGHPICPEVPKSTPPTVQEESKAERQRCKDIMITAGLLQTRPTKDQARRKGRKHGREGKGDKRKGRKGGQERGERVKKLLGEGKRRGSGKVRNQRRNN